MIAITKEKLETRHLEIEKSIMDLKNYIAATHQQIEQLTANLNACLGAKSEIENLLALFNEPPNLEDVKRMFKTDNIEVINGQEMDSKSYKEPGRSA